MIVKSILLFRELQCPKWDNLSLASYMGLASYIASFIAVTNRSVLSHTVYSYVAIRYIASIVDSIAIATFSHRDFRLQQEINPAAS